MIKNPKMYNIEIDYNLLTFLHGEHSLCKRSTTKHFFSDSHLSSLAHIFFNFIISEGQNLEYFNATRLLYDGFKTTPPPLPLPPHCVSL